MVHEPARHDAVALSRVAVWYGDTQVDLALPSRDPISRYIDDVVDTMGQQVDLPTGTRGSGRWPDWNRPLKPENSLADARVDDGAILELRLVAPTERYRPVIEDVVDAVAAAAAANTRPFDAEAARTAGPGSGWRPVVRQCAGQWAAWAASGYRWFAAVAGILLGLASLGAMWSAASQWRAPAAAASWSVVWITWVSCLAQVIPVSNTPFGRPGLAHVVVAAVAMAAAALVALWITGRHAAAYSAVAAAALVAAVSVGVVQYSRVSAPAVAAGAVAFGLVGLFSSPRLATMRPKIALPRIPAPGQQVDNAADISDTEMKLLETRAARAVQLTLGLTAASVIVICVAAAFVIDPHSTHRWIQIGIVVATIIVLVLTGRMLPDRRLSYAMFVGAGVVLAISVARLLIGWPNGAAPTVVLLSATALLAVSGGGRVGGGAPVDPRDGVELDRPGPANRVGHRVPTNAFIYRALRRDQGHSVPMSRLQKAGSLEVKASAILAALVARAAGNGDLPAVDRRRVPAGGQRGARTADAAELRLPNAWRFGRHQLQ